MKVGIPMETLPGERRVAATPESVARLIDKLGFQVFVEKGAGLGASFTDAAYEKAGAIIVEDVWHAEVVLKIHPLEHDQLHRVSEGQVLVSMVQPAENQVLIEAIAERKATLIALDQVPRISRAQKMDVLSSMANIAGYRAVVEASQHYGGFFGMQMTAAGKTPPAKVLVIGAGVAGLAAIAAARGLGAEVFAFDTRPAVKDQVKSLGGKFLELEFEESGDGGGGYAKVMSKEFIDAEMALFREYAPKVDVVITTALIPGRKAPILWTADMVESMKHGSVVVDLAARNGGNCELTEPGEVTVKHGVTIIGHTDLTSRLPTVASKFFAQNLVHLLDDMGGAQEWRIDLEDEVVRGAIVLHRGEMLWPPPKPPPPPPAATPKPAPVVALPTAEKAEPETSGLASTLGMVGAALVFGLVGAYAPREFVQHFTVFILACFIGWQVVWNVAHALHTPLMSVTNAISGIIIVGGILQATTGKTDMAAILGAVAILVATINIAGGFLVTQRMLAMFRR
ncbi:MAG: Re/Si-specific NAD(P)(+) transhydrogenase subunit alpha [Deltaproteobacteria bacterium]|nr:MAG: Re/Si-specific NAD(P)(+) transhydrogenase subunit alpha [Deltaproteobacteria bacterium]